MSGEGLAAKKPFPESFLQAPRLQFSAARNGSRRTSGEVDSPLTLKVVKRILPFREQISKEP